MPLIAFAVNGSNVAYLLLLGVTVASTLLFFYHKREPTSVFGMTSLYLILGIFLNMEEVLASVLPVDLGEGYETNPGSAVLFPANLLIVLLLYRSKIADELKKLCFVLISVNLMVAILSFSMAFFVDGGDPLLKKLFSLTSSLGVILSAGLLVVDIVIVLFAYDRLERAPLWLRMSGPLLAALWFDAVGYSVVRHWIFGDPLRTTFQSQMACKTAAGVLYSLLLWLYLKVFDKDEQPSVPHVRGMARRFIAYFVNFLDYAEIRKQIQIDPTTGLHVGLRQALASYVKESYRSGQPIVILYMIKIQGYGEIRKRLTSEDYAALRTALSRVTELAYLHSQSKGTIGLIFLRDADVRQATEDLRIALNTRDDVGSYGKLRKWPSPSGKLNFVDDHFRFDPDDKNPLRASGIIDLVENRLDKKLTRLESSMKPADAEDSGITVAPASPRSPEPRRAQSRGPQPPQNAQEHPAPGLVGGGPGKRKLATRTEARRAMDATVTKFRGFVEAVEDGVAYLQLEDERGGRLEIEWPAEELVAKGIGERAVFRLTTRELKDVVKFQFAAEKPKPLSAETEAEIQDLLSHYETTGDDDDV